MDTTDKGHHFFLKDPDKSSDILKKINKLY
jgi:hypothetical protein